MKLNQWEVKPSLDGTLQLVCNGRAVLNLHRSIAENGEEYAISTAEYPALAKQIANALMACEILGKGGTL